MRVIRRARPEEAEAISRLALESKAHWAYSKAELAVFRAELTFSPPDLELGHAHVLEEGDRLLGFYMLSGLGAARAELDHVFVDPEALGRGVGAALFRHACALAANSRCTDLYVRSDPNAAGFYRALGCDFTGEIDSSIPGRRIPTFTFPLARVIPAADADDA
jgi:GNAT superfamily N-acetyltransferase